MARLARAEDEIERYRERIVEVAARLFAERGYAGVTFRSLAEGLGCSPMTPYRYFKAKEDILAAVRRSAYDRFARTQVAAAASADPQERLLELGRAYIRFGVEETDAYRLMFSLAQPNPSRYSDLREAELRAWRPLRAAIGAAIDAGLLVGDPDVLAAVFWSSVHGLVSLHVAGKLVHGADVDRLVEPMLHTLFEGNRPPVSRNRDESGESS